MKISRRNFLGKSLKAAAIAALAPVIVPLIKSKEITANTVDEEQQKIEDFKSGIAKFHTYNTCPDLTPQITIQDYRPGEPMKFQDLSDCGCCAKKARCTQGGKMFKGSMQV